MLNLAHGNPDQSNVQKMHNLQQSLVGDTAKLIRDFELSDSTHSEALATFLKWNDNKRMLIADHLSSLFAVKKVQDESGAKLLLLDVVSTLCGLGSFWTDAKVGAMSVIMSFFVRSHLDDKIQRE